MSHFTTSILPSPYSRLLDAQEAYAKEEAARKAKEESTLKTYLPINNGTRTPPTVAQTGTLMAVPKVMQTIISHLALSDVLKLTGTCRKGLELRQDPVVQLRLEGHVLQKLLRQTATSHVDNKPPNNLLEPAKQPLKASFEDLGFAYVTRTIGKLAIS